MENFEEQLRKDLHQFLLSMKVVSEREQSDACIKDERMPERMGYHMTKMN